MLAAGDGRHGSVKRVAAAVGAGSIAIQLQHRLFASDSVVSEHRVRQPVPVAMDGD